MTRHSMRRNANSGRLPSDLLWVELYPWLWPDSTRIALPRTFNRPRQAPRTPQRSPMGRPGPPKLVLPAAQAWSSPRIPSELSSMKILHGWTSPWTRRMHSTPSTDALS